LKINFKKPTFCKRRKVVVADMICAEALCSGRLIVVACAEFEFDDSIWKCGGFYN